MDKYLVSRDFAADKKRTVIRPNFTLAKPNSIDDNNYIFEHFLKDHFEEYFDDKTKLFPTNRYTSRGTFLTHLKNDFSVYYDVTVLFVKLHGDDVVSNISIIPSFYKSNHTSISSKDLYMGKVPFGIDPIKCFECKTDDYNKALNLVLSSIIFSKSLKDVIINRNYQGFIRAQNSDITFFNPTIERSEELAVLFDNFLKYIQENKRDLISQRDYVKTVLDQMHQVSHLDVNSSSRKYLEQKIEEILIHADSELDKIRPVGLGIEKFF